MPILGGCDAARQMRAYEAAMNKHRTTILGMSANAERENVLASGMDTFIPKPFVWGDLVESLQRVTNVFNKKVAVCTEEDDDDNDSKLEDSSLM